MVECRRARVHICSYRYTHVYTNIHMSGRYLPLWLGLLTNRHRARKGHRAQFSVARLGRARIRFVGLVPWVSGDACLRERFCSMKHVHMGRTHTTPSAWTPGRPQWRPCGGGRSTVSRRTCTRCGTPTCYSSACPSTLPLITTVLQLLPRPFGKQGARGAAPSWRALAHRPTACGHPSRGTGLRS